MQKIAIEIMIEIGMEQTQLFQCNRFHYADFRDSNRVSTRELSKRQNCMHAKLIAAHNTDYETQKICNFVACRYYFMF